MRESQLARPMHARGEKADEAAAGGGSYSVSSDGGTSSIAKSTPPMGAPNAAATPVAAPMEMKLILSASLQHSSITHDQYATK